MICNIDMFVILTLIFSTGGSLSAGELAGILETGKAGLIPESGSSFGPQGKEMVELWGRWIMPETGTV